MAFQHEEYEETTFSRKIILRNIRAARHGDVSAATRLIEVFVLAQKRRIDVPKALMTYLAACFRRIVCDGIDPAAALYLKRGAKGAPKHADKWVRDGIVALAVRDELHEQRGRRSIKRAIAGARQKLALSKRTAERAYANGQRVIEALDRVPLPPGYDKGKKREE